MNHNERILNGDDNVGFKVGNQMQTLVAALANGDVIDWHHWEGRVGSDTERELLAQLRAIEEISNVHRTQQLTTDDPTVTSHATATYEHPETWGRYEIVGLLGGGSYARVYKAKNPRIDQYVALKLLHPDRSQDPSVAGTVIKEGRLLAKLDHRNIAKVYDADQYDGRVGICMELVDGPSLKESLRCGRRNWEEAAVIGRQLCQALAAMHRVGVIHRDIKTENVVQASDGNYKVIDFGSGTDVRDLATGQFEGTPVYMAPERLLGGKATPQSDIYSLGVVLFHMVTNTYPVTGGDVDEIIEKHKKGESTLLKDVRPDLDDRFVDVVERALANDPAGRYRTAAEFDRALKRALVGDPTPPSSWVSRSKRWSPVAAAFVLMLLFAIYYWYWVRVRIDATLVRSTPSGAAEVLENSGVIFANDDLHLEFESNRERYVYVASVDDRGEDELLFPIEGLVIRNPIPAGEFELPGPGPDASTITWAIGSEANQERFVIFASKSPLPLLESFETSLERLLADQTDSGDLRTRGIRVEWDPDGEPGPKLPEVIEELKQRDDIWWREIILTRAQ